MDFLRHNLIAVLALFVALGGTSYAAIALPKNSVGTKQIRKSAVTTAKVKDGSLLRKDFKPGQLPAGPKGDTGARGPQGPTGETGATGGQGETGPRGPSNGHSSADNESKAVGSGAEDSLNVPAGSYVAMATAHVENTGAAGAGTVTCALRGAFPVDSVTVKLPADGANDDDTIALSGAITFSSPGTISVDCSNSGTAGQLTGLDIQAIRVETLTADEIV